MATPTSQNELRTALLWDKLERGAVKCRLCAHRCHIRPGKLGICGVRVNVGGELRTRVYGMATSLAVDPIEKKPLFHFFPGSRALSLATVGCNFSCKHCQNHELSQWARHRSAEAAVPGRFISPEEVVEAAEESRSKVIAYTYSEPTIFMEYALDIARLAAPRGLQNVFVTNGFMTEEAVELIAPHLHGANVDLKGADDRMLRRETKSHAGPVRRTIADLHRRGVWVEVTTLVIPGSNDDEPQLREVAEFIAGVDRDLPWHVSRFHPMHQLLDRPPTPPETLERALRLGEAAGLRHVYAGNLRLAGGEDTRCPGCGAVVIERHGFLVGRLRLDGGRCTDCGHLIAGRGLP
jgi:pyruvate formate lyase activating enzyme